MIIIDTNVISELMRPAEKRDMRVFRWIGSIPENELASTVINFAESLYGVERLPEGKRKQAIRSVLIAAFDSYFGDRVLLFDMEAAAQYAALVADRDRKGKPILHHDAQIAAIALVNGVAVATRDSDFQNCGVKVINPWDHAA